MSARHSLYGQSLVRSANSFSAVNLMNSGSSERHWIRDWVSPPKRVESSATPNLNSNFSFATPVPSTNADSTETSTSAGTPQPSYDLKIKTWILTDELPDAKDAVVDLEEEGDILDLLQYPYSGLKEKTTEARKAENNGKGLSDADIRGAVGGGDMLAGFSSSQAQVEKEEKAKLENEADKENNTSNESSLKQDLKDEEKLATNKDEEDDKQVKVEEIANESAPSVAENENENENEKEDVEME
ncbi:hypothetical protein PACTADRAFT_48733 [Pachysolen tannophilus NRRL Y-2460]|uniref:Uncharacterized protein n=1 Tax=Pachysolen tannophilus NRRL Y-2460 TaxID=669874 RepID=A0A1E4TYV3_PACTA|nr:hypothetical protein PACTADRAFT_48733 [Pachysolen tannophilus NRRL Y-2460]